MQENEKSNDCMSFFCFKRIIFVRMLYMLILIIIKIIIAQVETHVGMINELKANPTLHLSELTA